MSLLNPVGDKSNPKVQNLLLKSLPCPFLDTDVLRQPLWPTCAQRGALCGTWETKEERHELNRQHHSTDRVLPRQDVQCPKPREAHGGPAGPGLCLISAWHCAPLWCSILLNKVLACLVACGCNKTTAIKAKAHGVTVNDSCAQGSSCTQERLCTAPDPLRHRTHSLTSPCAQPHQGTSGCFKPAWICCLETCTDAPIPSYTDPTFPSPTCPSPLLLSVAHPAKTSVKGTASTRGFAQLTTEISSNSLQVGNGGCESEY